MVFRRVHSYAPGDIVLANVGSFEVVKRILWNEDSHYFLSGDNTGHTGDFVVERGALLGRKAL